MPSRRKVHWVRPRVLPAPPGFVRPHHPWSSAVNLAITPRKIPIRWDTKTKKPTAWLGGGRPVDEGGGRGRCELCCVNANRAGLNMDGNTHFSRFACLDCRVILCRGCWDLYDHTNQRCPPIAPPPDDDEPSVRKCPKGHTLHARASSGEQLRCDECSADLFRVGMSFLSCNHCDAVTGQRCDYDICIHCQGPSPALDRTERAAAHSPTESPTLAAATQVIAARRRSRIKPTRRPSRYQNNRAKSVRPEAVQRAAASAAAAKKRKAKRSSVEAARAAKKQKAGEVASESTSKRSQPNTDGSSGCKRRRTQ